jgi:hypothetical protein
MGEARFGGSGNGKNKVQVSGNKGEAGGGCARGQRGEEVG